MTTEQRLQYAQGERAAFCARLRGQVPRVLASEEHEVGGLVHSVQVLRDHRGTYTHVLRAVGAGGVELLDVDHVPACIAARAHQLWRMHHALP